MGDNFDPLPLYKVADVVLSDTSGAIFDALLIQKPLILLKSNPSKFKINIFGSEDNEIFDLEILPYAERPSQLFKLIEENIRKPTCLDENLMYKLFYSRDGKAGKRIADIVCNKAKMPLNPTIEKYEVAIKNAPDEESRNRIISLRDRFLSVKMGKTSQTIKQKLKRCIRTILR